MSSKEKDREYDICLSFAGEDRDFVRAVAASLRESGVRVFYDEYQEVELWGKDLYEHLDDVYKNAARYCVLFASRRYAEKLWTTHERRSAQERAIKENREYILPARFDDTPIPGLRDTVGYIDLRKHKPETLAALIRRKVGEDLRKDYLPPNPDRLFTSLKIRNKRLREQAYEIAHNFLRVLRRTTKDERRVIFELFRLGCPGELPENMHRNIDLVRRGTGFPPSKIRRLFAGLRSLGFSTSVREDTENDVAELGTSEMLVVSWTDMSYFGALESTAVAQAMIDGATENYCEKHGWMALERLDFSQLSTATTVKDRHPRKRVKSRSTTK